MPYEITDERRTAYRECSQASAEAKSRALSGEGPAPTHPVYTPRLDPAHLMPPLPPSGFQALSLFSGGGGLDLGFERAGFGHTASYDWLPICGETLLLNRPSWRVFAGERGNVAAVDWTPYTESIDVVHGGPPCQPFSIAGKQKGHLDERDMWPELVRAVASIRPRAFVAENVTGLLDPKFGEYVQGTIIKPLRDYRIFRFKLHSAMFGVPQSRQRVFFVGFRSEDDAERFAIPAPTHCFDGFAKGGQFSPQPRFFEDSCNLPECIGVREALGLPDIGVDGLAPTLRSGFTGPRNSTSVLNSVASQRIWANLEVWPNGVAETREKASLFVAKDGHFRMSLQDCAIVQGFPEFWRFAGSVYKVLGQIGNSVSPPMGYAVATAVRTALGG